MNKYKFVLFDLDGTLSESADGIRKSLEYAITSLGKPLPDLDDYTLYIGPPLIDTFRKLCRFDEEDCQKGLVLYRDFYNAEGKYLNKLYDGVKETLEALKQSGAKTAVCTSKYEKFAEEIVGILGITEYFDAVCGSTFDGCRKDKKDLIPYAVSALGGDIERDRRSTVMLGDTYFDARGARLSGVDFIGVKYGYGSVDAMKNEGAASFADSPSDISKLL